MRTLLRRLLCGTALLSASVVSGCALTFFTILIPDFASKEVDGVWLWRHSTGTGTFQRASQLTFLGTSQEPDGEMLDYVLIPSDGSVPVPMTAFVDRTSPGADAITVRLLFTRSEGTGFYKASTYNVDGDSQLSTEIGSF